MNAANSRETVCLVDPVHPDCQVVTQEKLRDYTKKLEAAGEREALKQLAGALEIVITDLKQRADHWRN